MLILFLMPAGVFAVSDSIDISAEVTSGAVPFCNHNGICETWLGETISGCPSDCGCNHNGICETQRMENESNCPDDCRRYSMGGSSHFQIMNLSMEKITPYSADIIWYTTFSAFCSILWGKTSEYEAGSITETSLNENHKITISNLKPRMTYHFNLICISNSGDRSESGDNRFSTPPSLDDIAPANVSDFSVMPGDKKISLSWKNPQDLDFEEVRVIKSDKFYPADIFDGEMVYSGKGNSFIDENVENEKRYYYAVFACDKNRNCSSGAVVSAIPYFGEEPTIIPIEEIPSEIEVPVEIEKLNIEDFEFFIEGKKVSLKDGVVETQVKSPLTISLDYKKVPEVLKTIMITLEKENKFFSFLLKINEDKTAYTATLVSPEEAGVYPLIMSVLDYKNHNLKKINGELEVFKKTALKGFLLWQKKSDFYRFVFYFLIGIFLIFLSMGIIRKKKDLKVASFPNFLGSKNV